MNSILTEPFFQRALLAGIAVALVSGPVGCFIVWRRMAYFGESLAHVCCEGGPEKVQQDPEFAKLFGPSAARMIAAYAHHHDHDHEPHDHQHDHKH